MDVILNSKQLILDGILLLALCNVVFLLFNPVHQNSRLKIITFYCHTLYLKNLIFRHFRKPFFQKSLLYSPCFSIHIKEVDMNWRI